jgi:gamma-glutamyltranspeptidase/glutathione hydrolase
MAKSMRIGSTALVLGSLMITSTAVLADTKKRADTPEAGSGYKAKAAKTLKTRGVSSANPLASEAGHAILKAGGSAVDAAIAVQMVLNLAAPSCFTMMVKNCRCSMAAKLRRTSATKNCLSTTMAN